MRGLKPAPDEDGTIARRRADSSRGIAAAGAVLSIAALGLAVVSPGQRTLWSAVHGTEPADMFLAEDGSGVAVLKTRQAGYDGKVVVFVNGLSQSTIPYGEIHTVLGALPMVIHPDPRDIAVIGLGSGDTAYSAAGRPSIERVVCVEIIRSQLTTLKELNRQRPDGGVTALLTDPRIEHEFGDGRAYLLKSDRLYDIIEADALRPKSAYAGNLYSEEYFKLLQSRLKPRGLAVSWVPTPRVRTAFLNVFPHVISMGTTFIGSNQPIAFDRQAIAARLADPRVRRHYQVAGVDIDSLLQRYLDAAMVYAPGEGRDSQAETNTDLFPRDEYDLGPIFQRW
jgi:spermidine synthase